MLLQAKISAVAEREAACAAKGDDLKQRKEEQAARAADLQVQACFLPFCCACTFAVSIYVPPLMQTSCPQESSAMCSGPYGLTCQISVASDQLYTAHRDQIA